MAFLDRVLDPPSYGFVRDQKLYVPTTGEIFREFFARLNLLKSRKAWLPLFSWLIVLFFLPFFLAFFFLYFSWPLFVAAFLYSMVFMGAHGTVYLHRYGSHHAFSFSNRFWRFLVRELSIKTVPEEVYVVSHHVHHYLSEKPGDPYNVFGGWLYCFLADVNHQAIARDFSRADYDRAAKMIGHMGVRPHAYEQYQKWGSISRPFDTVLHFTLNWAFWFGVFYLIGGIPLATAIFAGAGVWAVGIRTFNFEGHGGGKDRRREGIDFDRSNLSINQAWPGMITGEWHNNHHLYPNGARAGFLPGQWDFAWDFIRAVRFLRGIRNVRDFTEDFLQKHYRPYLSRKAAIGPEALKDSR